MIPSSTEPVTTASVSNRDTSSTENHADYPDADIVLRSSDSQDFQVQKLFILKSSPVLNKLIQVASDLSDDTIPVHAETFLPVVQLSEDGTILSSLLTFLLPMLPVLPPTLEETIELLSVAQKYEMSHVLVHIRGSIALKDPPLVNKSNALYVYSLAQKYGLRQEMVRAARITLKSTLTIESLQGKLNLMPSDHLHELWMYHQRVRANLMTNVNEFRRSAACTALKSLHCVLTSSKILKWIDDYIVSLASTPSLFDLTEFQSALAQHAATAGNSTGGPGRGCSFCACLPGQTIDEFWTALTTFVHENTETVSMAHLNYVA